MFVVYRHGSIARKHVFVLHCFKLLTVTLCVVYSLTDTVAFFHQHIPLNPLHICGSETSNWTTFLNAISQDLQKMYQYY